MIQNSLPAAIPCDQCRRLMEVLCPDRTVVSRSDVFELHGQHKPPHPSEVGANHRRAAAKAYAEWEAGDPYARRELRRTTPSVNDVKLTAGGARMLGVVAAGSGGEEGS